MHFNCLTINHISSWCMIFVCLLTTQDSQTWINFISLNKHSDSDLSCLSVLSLSLDLIISWSLMMSLTSVSLLVADNKSSSVMIWLMHLIHIMLKYASWQCHSCSFFMSAHRKLNWPYCSDVFCTVMVTFLLTIF